MTVLEFTNVLGVPKYKKTCDYLKRAIELALEDKEHNMGSIMFVISKEFSISTSAIEVGMKRLIREVYPSIPDGVKHILFGNTKFKNGVPTNGAFVKAVAYALENDLLDNVK